jgi:hypothetical protein
MVDPQLRKNAELVKVLKIFEDSWSLAKEFFDDERHLYQLNWFSGVLQQKQSDHREFREQIEYRDSIIFMSIPSLLVYLAATRADMEATAVCDRFWPAMRQSTQYSEVVKGVAELRNERPQLEKVVLEIEVSGDAVSIKGKQMG